MAYDHVKLGDAALAAWGELVAKDDGSGIGYPSASVEGRARRDGIGRSGQPACSLVPRLASWSRQDDSTHRAVKAMPVAMRRVASVVYVDALKSKKAIEKLREERNMSLRTYNALLRECRTWVAGWLAREAEY